MDTFLNGSQFGISLIHPKWILYFSFLQVRLIVVQHAFFFPRKLRKMNATLLVETLRMFVVGGGRIPASPPTRMYSRCYGIVRLFAVE